MHPSSDDLRVEVHGGEDLYGRFAELIAARLVRALDERGRATLALSRGSDAFRHLATRELRWDAVEVFQVDERAAPGGSPERNLTSIERELGRSGARVHPMAAAGDLEEGARAYASELEAACGSPPALDVVHLGIGPDGHTASLLGGDPVLDVEDRWVATTGLHDGHRRLTLTFPVLDAARLVVFLGAGEAKSEAVRGVIGGDASLPAARVRAAEVWMLIDDDAARSARRAKLLP